LSLFAVGAGEGEFKIVLLVGAVFGAEGATLTVTRAIMQIDRQTGSVVF